MTGVDVDSFVGQTHAYDKQGAPCEYSGIRGYHPLLATRADAGEELHVPCRKGRKGAANTARGVLRSVEELIRRLHRAGGPGEKLLRADSGF